MRSKGSRADAARAPAMDEPKLCPICSKPFRNEADLGAHLARCLERVGPQKKPLKKPQHDDDSRGRVLCYVWFSGVYLSHHA